MSQSIRLLSVLVSCALMLPGATTSAEQIYRWVGSDGATYFSETPPAAASGEVEILDVTSEQQSNPPSTDYRSALAVAKDIESSRLERERLRLEKEQLRRQNEQLRQSQPTASGYQDNSRGVYYTPYGYYPPKQWRRHHYHRPRYPEPYGRPHQVRPPQGRVHIRQ